MVAGPIVVYAGWVPVQDPGQNPVTPEKPVGPTVSDNEGETATAEADALPATGDATQIVSLAAAFVLASGVLVGDVALRRRHG